MEQIDDTEKTDIKEFQITQKHYDRVQQGHNNHSR